MTDQVIFLTHAEVRINSEVPVVNWPLDDMGRARHARFADSPVLSQVTSVWASEEQKAMGGAAPMAARLDQAHRLREDLGENDRSATGYLPPDAFLPMVARFFASPDESAEGWETARASQARIKGAVGDVVAEAPDGDVLIVSHGGVVTLLRCHLKRRETTRDESAPHPGGGCWFAFDRAMTMPPTDWTAI